MRSPSPQPKKSTSLPNGLRCWKRRRSRNPKLKVYRPFPRSLPIERGRGGTARIWCSKMKLRCRFQMSCCRTRSWWPRPMTSGRRKLRSPRTPMTRKAGPARWRKFPQGRLLRQQVLRPREYAAGRGDRCSAQGTAAGRGIDRFASARTRRSGGRGARARPGTAAGSFAQASTRRA